jgi:hypothetical protein
MTLLTAFLRTNGRMQELVVASDSRLSGNGQRTDHSQKVFTLPRSDALLAFAGDTQYAYPLLMQLIASIDYFAPSRERRLPLGHLQAHTLRVFQQSYDAIHGFGGGRTRPLDPPDNFFLFGGYDWETTVFKVWLLHFDRLTNRFRYNRAISTGTHQYIFVGDNTDAVKHAYNRTGRLLGTRRRSRVDIDMEPFTALLEICGDRTFDTIGGVPQIGKVYKHLNSQLFLVKAQVDGASKRARHFAGRPLNDLERNDLPTFDPAVGFYPREYIEAEYRHAVADLS